MASSHGADRISARRDLGDNPRLVLIAPCPPPPGAGKHLQPADWLRDSTMFSVHSKPSGQNQTADSQISTSSGRWPQNTAYAPLAAFAVLSAQTFCFFRLTVERIPLVLTSYSKIPRALLPSHSLRQRFASMPWRFS